MEKIKFLSNIMKLIFLIFSLINSTFSLIPGLNHNVKNQIKDKYKLNILF
jgi:hypothetical protein